MKKIGIKKGIKRILACIILIFFCYHFWKDGLSQFVPWTRTYFVEYEIFISFLDEQNCFGSDYFLENVEPSTQDVKYYWHQQFVEKFAAYSMFVETEDFINILQEQLENYREEDIKYEAEENVYEFQGENYCYIEESEMYMKYFSFVDEVLHNTNDKKGYYFVVINKINTAKGTCFNGVIANDTTLEIIEFSALIRPENL